jgi:hypothetical protein
MLDSVRDIAHPPKKVQVPSGAAALAAWCLAKANHDPARAVALAAQRARGAQLRAVVHHIGNAILRSRRGR